MGFEQQGFSVVWSNESNGLFSKLYSMAYPRWRRTVRRQFPDAYKEVRSIEELDPATIVHRAFGKKAPRLFGIVGGPPCPDFSGAGRHRGHNGDHGRLTKTYVDLICDLGPSFFVLENVAGLARFSKHKEFLEKMERQLGDAGYAIDRSILNSLELGVPQYRERLFVVGIKRTMFEKYRHRVASVDPVAWFPWPSLRKYRGAVTAFAWPDISRFGATPRVPRGVPLELCVGPYMIRKKDLRRIPNAGNCFKAYSGKFGEVPEGYTRDKSFKRLHRYRYSPTACYGNNEVHLHPWEPRRLSLREAMRIQGIPDTYVLPDDVALTYAFKMVGNGVPVPVSRHLARSLTKVLNIVV